MTQQEVIKIVKDNQPQVFQKFGEFKFRIAEQEEKVETIIDGVKETEKTAQPGDIVLTGPKGEQYTISKDTFAKRYIVKDDVAYPTGLFYGNIYNGESFKFQSPWGDEMICDAGDYLGSPDATFSEAYRIERGAFDQTYKPLETGKLKWGTDLYKQIEKQ